MKTFGLVLAALGGGLVLSSFKLMVTEYDMNDTRDMSKAIGGLSFSFGMIAIGATIAYANWNQVKDKSPKDNQSGED